jgi:drug/metabolite transporter (DMT)-like permease
MRDVPGDRIGQVVAEVEAHVAESREAPVEAFGSAEEYADRISAALDRPATQRHRQTLRGMLIGWPITLAAMLTADGVAGLAFGQRIELTVGKLLLFALLPPAAVGLIQLIGRQERPSWQTGLGVALIFAGVFSVPWLLPRPVLATYPAWAALTAAVGLAAGAIPWAVRPDLIIDPRDGRNRYPLSRRLVLIMAAGIALPLLILVLAGIFLPRTA